MPWRSIQVAAYINSLLLFILSDIPWWIYQDIFEHSVIEGYFVSNSWLIQIKLLWTIVHMFLCGHTFSLLWDNCPGMQLLVCVVKYIFSCYFCFSRNCQTIFQSDYIMLHFHQRRLKHPISPHPPQQLVLLLFFILAVLVGIWYLILFSVTFSLMPHVVEHFFTWLLDILMPSLVKYLLCVLLIL